jgi:hypothetical protein
MARHAAVTAAELDRLRACRDAVLFPPDADPFLRADRLVGGAQLAAGVTPHRTDRPGA